jgi:hypothetical protein
MAARCRVEVVAYVIAQERASSIIEWGMSETGRKSASEARTEHPAALI